jgi:hypothetical protein
MAKKHDIKWKTAALKAIHATAPRSKKRVAVTAKFAGEAEGKGYKPSTVRAWGAERHNPSKLGKSSLGTAATKGKKGAPTPDTHGNGGSYTKADAAVDIVGGVSESYLHHAAWSAATDGLGALAKKAGEGHKIVPAGGDFGGGGASASWTSDAADAAGSLADAAGSGLGDLADGAGSLLGGLLDL